MVTFRVVDNDTDRCVISIIDFFCDPAEVDGAEDIVLWHWVGADGELGRCGWLSGGVVWWGTMDRVGDSDFGGVEGCTNSVKPEVEDMVMSVW